MVMDSSKEGVAGRLTVIASVAGVVAVLLGGVWSLANTVNTVSDKLDRNLVKIESVCLAQKALDADLRLHIALESRPIDPKGHDHPQLDPFPSVDC